MAGQVYEDGFERDLDDSHSQQSGTALDTSPSCCSQADRHATQQEASKPTQKPSGQQVRLDKIDSQPYLKNATRERDRSSRIVREDAKMDRRTAGVTGIRLAGFGLGTGGRSKDAFPPSRTLAAVTVGVEDVEVVEGGIVDVVCSSDKRTRVNANLNDWARPDVLAVSAKT